MTGELDGYIVETFKAYQWYLTPIEHDYTKLNGVSKNANI